MDYGYEDFEEEKGKVKTFAVKNINLLYRLAENNLLEYLLNVSTDWNDPEKRVWIFEKNTYVQDVINEFYLHIN